MVYPKSLTQSITGLGCELYYAKQFLDPLQCISFMETSLAPVQCCGDPNIYAHPIFCENPAFTFSLAPTPNAQCYNTDENVICPTAGILDALTQSQQSDPPWGFGYTPHDAVQKIPVCYDATIRQQNMLYSLTHQFCPNLSPAFSYSSDMRVLLQPPNLECCVRDNQADPTGCHMMECFESPLCIDALRSSCSQNIHTDICQKWLSYSGSDESVVLPGDSISTSGSNPATFDQAYMSVLDFCSNSEDKFTCDSILAVGGGLLFPRFDSLHISDFVNQLIVQDGPTYSLNTNIQTFSFSITNMSNVLIQSLSVRQSNPNYSVTIFNRTLLPFQTTGCRLTTTLTQNDSVTTYLFSKTQVVVTDGYNLNNDCVNFGIFVSQPGTTDPSLHSTISQDYFNNMPKCANGDLQIGFSSMTTPWQFGNDSNTCGTNSIYCVPWGLDWTHQPFPGCRYECETNPGFGVACPGNTTFNPQCDVFKGSCAPHKQLFTTLTLIKTCTTQNYSNHPFYFYDSTKVDLTNPLNISRQDFPVLGGFVASMENNIMDLSFVSQHLVALPLTGASFLSS